MNRDQAIEMMRKFSAIGGFNKVDVQHSGFLAERTPETDNDGLWRVELWLVNAKAGNRTLEEVKDYADNDEFISILAKVAKGKATAKDKAALNRIRAERAVNNE